uniref:Uncharacterized protein n=1 Tax=Brassica campestris TaxID=3711 RepID=A0A3P5ZHD1_BRACM|nr:unnamed protein product [Brassica rapa]
MVVKQRETEQSPRKDSDSTHQHLFCLGPSEKDARLVAIMYRRKQHLLLIWLCLDGEAVQLQI